MLEDKNEKMGSDQLEELLSFREDAVDYKDLRYSAEWRENMDFYFGNQYAQEYLDDIALWRSATVNNIIYPTVEQLHSLMTDDESIAFVQRESGGSYQMERIMDSIIKQVWEKQDVISELSLADKDRLITGTSFIKTFYDKKSKDYLKIGVKRISPWDFYPDPTATDIQNARFVFERERVSKAYLLEKYPQHYELIIGAEGNAGDSIGEEGNSKYSSDYDNGAIFIWHCFINELSEIEEDIESEEQARKIQRTYPNGKYVVLLGNMVLEEVKNPVSFFPYVKIPLIEIPDEFWGMSVVTQMKRSQQELNRIESSLIDNMQSNTNPILIASQGIIDEEFVPTPNSIVTLQDPTDRFEKMPGTQLPSEVFAMMSSKKDETRASAGVTDVTFGQGAQSSRPGTVRANFNASITRVREYLRLKHRAISHIGRNIIKMVQKNVPAGTTISLINPDDAIFDVSDPKVSDELVSALQDPNVAKNLEVQDIVIKEQSQEFKDQLFELISGGAGSQIFSDEEARSILMEKQVKEFKNDLSEGEYTYAINTHPLSVNDPDKMMELMTTLLQYGVARPEAGIPGIVDFQFVLEQIPLKGKEALIRRNKRKQQIMEQQLQAQAQAQAQQQQGGQ